ncbi:MAG: C4-dicarboxylate ABC transporter, partial [Rhodobacterales bacterium CG_4_9_14_3_um_filter_71_31]
MTDKSAEGLSQAELDELVAAADTGGRQATGFTAWLILAVALCWSLFQLWFASPIPFMVGFGVFNDTQARSIHLGFAMFLAFAAYPAARSSFQLILGVGVPVLMAVLFMVGARGTDSTWWIPLVALGVAAAVLLGSPRERVPAWEWALAALGAGAA